MPSFQEKSPLKSEQLQQSTVCQDFYYHSIISSIGTKIRTHSQSGKSSDFFRFVETTGLDYWICPWGQIHMVTASFWTGCCDMPPAYRIEVGSSPCAFREYKNTTQQGGVFILVETTGLDCWFCPGGKIIWWQPVFELAVAICHRHIAFEWVRVPGFPGNKKATRMGQCQ